MADRPQHPELFYYSGPTPFFASRFDQRFSYCLYVPTAHDEKARALPLVVLQHGTGRRASEYRDAFADFAEAHRCVVLAPLFPAGIDDSADLHNFKFIKYRDVRFDTVLLEIIAEVGERFNVSTSQFLLHGYSGGGQFAHRFLYLHPDRITGVSIGAPGRITLLDPDHDWWLGTRDIEQLFGVEIDVETLRRVPVQMVVGSLDTETWEINNPGFSNWLGGAAAAGETRVDRLRSLESNFHENGIAVRFDVVEGVAHDALSVLEPVRDFFAEYIRHDH